MIDLKMAFNDFNDFRHQKEKDIAKWLIGKYILEFHPDTDNNDVWISYRYGIIEEILDVNFYKYEIQVKINNIESNSENVKTDFSICIDSVDTTVFIFDTKDEIENKLDVLNKKLAESKKYHLDWLKTISAFWESFKEK